MLALTSTQATLGLVVVFLVFFPAVVTGLLALIGIQIMGERDANHKYARRRRGE